MSYFSLSTLVNELIRKLTPVGVTEKNPHAGGGEVRKAGLRPLSEPSSTKEKEPMERHDIHNLTISKRGLAFIKKWEGCRLAAYQDSAGVWTVGYGHTSGVIKGMSISPLQAEALLRNDLLWVEHELRKLIEPALSQSEYDALCSFVFNVGGSAFAESTLLRDINELRFNAAADQFLRWTHAGGRVVQGLVNRRRDERLLFTGHYTS